MTVQAVSRNRWLLRVLLVAGAALLVSMLWFATAAHASAQDEVAGDGEAVLAATPPEAAAADVAPGDGVAPSGDDPAEPAVASDPAPPTDVPALFSVLVEVPEPALAPVEEAPPEVVPAPEPEAPQELEQTSDAPEPTTDEPVLQAVAPVVTQSSAVAVVSATSWTAPGAPLTPDPQQLPAVRAHTAERSPVTPAVAAEPPAAPAVAVDPCPPVAPPVAATARPAGSWSHGLDGDGWPRHRDDPVPVAVVSPPNVEHVRGGSHRGDDPRPTDGPTAGLPTATSATSSSGRVGALGRLPAGVQPPQLRVLSSRAGPCAGLVPAPHVEILDLPA